MSPLTVTAWPVFPDPRGPGFSIRGYGFGMVAPNQFFISTTGALPPYDDLNDGLLLPFSFDLPASTEYKTVDNRNIMTKRGFVALQVGPPPWSIEITISVIRPAVDFQTGFVRFNFPDAIRTYSVQTVPTGVGPQLIPNPILATPRNFSATA